MALLDQTRAQLAFEHVSAFERRPEAERKKYATMVHKLPALLSSAGLCQALYFVDARDEEAQRVLLDHLAQQLGRISPAIRDRKSLLQQVREERDLGTYLRLSREAFVCAAWYRRLVQGLFQDGAAMPERANP